MGKAEGREETNEASGSSGDSTGGLSGSPEDVNLPKEKKSSSLREYAETLIVAIIMALVIRTFVVQAFKIPSGSMLQTLQIGDHILVNKFIYGIRLPFTDITLVPVTSPKRRDVIVFRYPEDESKDFIKRVVGIPGDKLEIKGGLLYVNDNPQRDEVYVNAKDTEAVPHIVALRDNFGPIVVPKESYFVMGDNRNHSLDSRFWGFVHNTKIKGEAFIIYWSWNTEETSVRFGRIGKLIH